MRIYPVAVFKQYITLKVINTIITRQPDIGHFETLAITYAAHAMRKITNISTIIINIRPASCRPAKTGFLIARCHARLVVIALQ